MPGVEIVALHTSPRHAYEGRPAEGPRPDPEGGARDHVVIRAGHGAVGDRYAGRPAHREAAVTVIAVEALEHVAAVLGLPAVPDPLLTRRTIVLRGADVDGLARTRDRPGAVFTLDSGDGPVRLRAHRPASPCAWMETVLGTGAFRALWGRGGVRCEPLTDGVLRVGPARLETGTGR
ncbi:molybdenum cofactor biosysynthesis protein [Pseudonocardia hydrocarbonoxydans]|uniref:molybdenum cofactor biosysynthesis protein n=1 Tax=Pseudonocardia hydrocarbonoxydans TaxID=76726 RepID=UPI001FECA3CE|nr:molybdenum cofactor biosysynthesis protein [Pseudonocardia hydrocarbonoxydans]